MPKMKLSAIDFDHELYPRLKLDPLNVSRLKEAIETGATLPPIIVAKDGRGVDGAHRKEVFLALYGAEGEVEVEIRRYANDSDLVLDAVTINNAHGLHLGSGDKTHCEMLLQRVGCSVETISKALGRIIQVIPSAPVATIDGKKVPLKPSMRHLNGQSLTAAQAEANKKAGGNTQTFLVRQLLGLFRSGSIARDSQHLEDLLRDLHVELQRYLDAVTVPQVMNF